MVKFKRQLSNKFYRINHYIQAREIRVVDEKGKQLGVMSLSQALKQAQDKGLDLIEVAPKAQPPVCKIIDFKKFKYLESKKAQEEKKKSKRVEIKEVHLTPFMAANDFNFRIKRAEHFLKEGHKVRLVVEFRGREMDKKDFGYKLVKQALERLGPYSKIDAEPRFLGRQLTTILSSGLGRKNGQEAKNEN